MEPFRNGTAMEPRSLIDAGRVVRLGLVRLTNSAIQTNLIAI
jgi:hypothetical protein